MSAQSIFQRMRQFGRRSKLRVTLPGLVAPIITFGAGFYMMGTGALQRQKSDLMEKQSAIEQRLHTQKDELAEECQRFHDDEQRFHDDEQRLKAERAEFASTMARRVEKLDARSHKLDADELASAIAHGTGEFLGVHTCVPALLEQRFAPTVLHGNYKLPPYIICTGNGERVRASLKYLDKAVLLKDVMCGLGQNPFRIEIAVGLYKGTPVMIFEHQIGSGSTEIYLKELLSNHCMSEIYRVESTGNCFTADAKYLIRLGTSLGINNSSDCEDSVVVQPGDIAVSTHQVGISGTDFQAMTSNLNIFDAESSVDHAKSMLTEMGYKMESIGDQQWPVVQFDETVADTMSARVAENYAVDGNDKGYKCVSLGNVSKDSLYSEEAPRTFTDLRKHAEVGTSDMEAAVIMRTTKQMTFEHQNRIKVGFSSIILGTLSPDGGDSFTDFDRTLSSQVQWQAALETLHEISQKHIN